MWADFFLQMKLMGLEALLVGTVLLAFFHFRKLVGLAPLHATLAMFYQLATVMAGAFYMEVGDDLMMSPASAVLFPATVFALLLVYIREDTRQARQMTYGVLAANFVIGLLGLGVGQYVESAAVLNPLGLPAELLSRHPRLVAMGALALLVDVSLIVATYDYLGRFFRRWLLIRIYVASAFVLVVETLIFVPGGFHGSPHFESILLSALAGKLLLALVYSILLSGYLRLTAIGERGAARTQAPDSGVLTFREKYEHLQEQSMRDPLTGLLHRGMFDSLLPAQLARCARHGKSLTLLMVDIDRFKQVNDMFGHREGDEVIRVVAGAMQASVRGSDFACRFGGEEFAIVLPDTDAAAALVVAERMRERVTQQCRLRTLAGTTQSLTISVGLATAPGESTTAEGLVELADRRLYEAKRGGRDRVASTGMFAPLPPSYCPA